VTKNLCRRRNVKGGFAARSKVFSGLGIDVGKIRGSSSCPTTTISQGLRDLQESSYTPTYVYQAAIHPNSKSD
jgi:hypothetical protein